MTRFAFCCALAFALCLDFSAAGERLPYPCYKLAEAPVLDGKLDDAVWQALPRAQGFFLLGGSRYASVKQTWFQAGWTKDALYIAVSCEETSPEKMTASKEDGASLWSEDSVEIFFLPLAVGKKMQFIVNSAAARWNESGGRFPPLSAKAWEARTTVGKDAWNLEVRFPFALLGKMPEQKEAWPFNVARNILTGPADERHTSWPPLISGFHDVDHFASLIFSDKPEADASREEAKLNSVYFNHLSQWAAELAKLASSYETVLALGLKHEKLKSEASSLQAQWGALRKIAAPGNTGIESLVELSRECRDLKERSDNLKARVLMESLFEE
jgi:hypothetical protein